MLNITQVRDDLLSKLGIEDNTLAPALALQDVVIAINGAMQTLQMAGQDFFTREKLNIGFSAGTAMYPLTQTIQEILGPVRLNDSQPLRALMSRGELDQFDRIFNGTVTFGESPGLPIAYFVENLRYPTGPDANQVNLWLAPVPQTSGFLVIEVVKDAPSYLVSDLPTAAVLPVAQAYTESIFLPIARMFVTRSSQFSRPDILKGITADFETAIARLGAAGGFPPMAQPEPERADNE
jgi:hypothetical protein